MTIIEKTAFAGSDIQDIIIDGPFTVKISDDASTGVRFRVNEYLEGNISYLLNGTTLRIKLNDGAVVKNSTLDIQIGCNSVKTLDIEGGCSAEMDRGFDVTGDAIISVAEASNLTANAYLNYQGSLTITLSGASSFTTNSDISTSGELAILVNGASNVSIENLVAGGPSSIVLEDASELTIAGMVSNSTEPFNITLKEASSIKASDFRVPLLNIEASGASHASVKVSNKLTANLTGASKLEYKTEGNVNVDVHTSGGSSATQL